MTSLALVCASIVGLAVGCAATWAIAALREFSRSRLEDYCRRRHRNELLGAILLHHERVNQAAECARLLAALVAVGCGLSWHWLANGQFSALAPWGATDWIVSFFAGAAVLLIVTYLLPEALARTSPEAYLVRTWPGWLAVAWILRPLTAAAELATTMVRRLAGLPAEAATTSSIEEEIRTIVSAGHREGLLEGNAREMIEGVIELDDVHVSEIMTPRTEMVSMPVQLEWPDVLRLVTNAGHTRIPVFDKNRDDVVGILCVKDLLPELAKQDPATRRPLAEIVRKPHFVPETKRVDALLQEFQLTRNHMAVVLDEYGGVSGLVTIEDVLEEIVGEIVDEYDEEHVAGVRRIDDRTCEALARVHIDDINEQLHLDLPEESEYDTVGGFVFHKLGRLPVRGEQLEWNNLRITVLDVSRRRIERVRIETLDPSREQELQDADEARNA